MKLHSAALAAIGFALMTGGFAAAQDARQTDVGKKGIEQHKPDFAPCPNQNFPNQVYWGVAHVHTGYSFDAGMFGITLTPDDLFKVATGGEVVLDNGLRFKQDRSIGF